MSLTLSACPCCIPATLVGVVVIIWIIIQIFENYFIKSKTFLSKILYYISRVFSIIIILIAIFFGLLETNDELRKIIFSIFCSKMSQGGELDVLRCGMSIIRLLLKEFCS